MSTGLPEPPKMVLAWAKIDFNGYAHDVTLNRIQADQWYRAGETVLLLRGESDKAFSAASMAQLERVNRG